uniref:ATPase subunit 6 n=1 Tax=Dactylogyrus lamellatus TaxID=231327 RepID=A0A342K3V5_9PLAT|nr:ATPase subunit 6 [Dactylogyrus lamellatus]ALP29099.1 ATPase subunit 6 [Dactylogyrus lamellatus]
MLNINRGVNFFLQIGRNTAKLGSVSYFILLVVLMCFLTIRVPGFYGLSDFIFLLLTLIFPIFLGLFFNRLGFGLDSFISSMIPAGTPMWVAPLVGLAEMISYFIRPLVLMLRPFLNITIGVFGSLSLGSLCLGTNALLLVLVIIFFYELFVAFIQWYIVASILDFSIDH